MKNTKAMPGQITFWDFVPNPSTVAVSKTVVVDVPVPAPQRKSKPVAKLSPIQKFYKDFNGVVIEDCITVTGDDFKSFCRKLKNALKKEALLAGFDDVTLRPNHYDMGGFFRKGDKYVYWHFDVERGDMPTYFDKHHVLYRTAKSEKDSTGGANHYTDLQHLVSEAYNLI